MLKLLTLALWIGPALFLLAYLVWISKRSSRSSTRAMDGSSSANQIGDSARH
jgi:cytochrome c-type biogenesis protein CcmH/NrfF